MGRNQEPKIRFSSRITRQAFSKAFEIQNMTERDPYKVMKNKNGIAIIALVGILLSCFFVVGCSYLSGYITIDSRSKVMKPTFCIYLDRCFRHHQERLDIDTITVVKVRRSSEEKKGWKFDSPVRGEAVHDGWYEAVHRVWYIEYKSSDNFIKRLFGLSASPVSCLTYGEVPPGYEEGVKARPLEPEELYSVWIETYKYPGDSKPLKFIIRLDGKGTPERLEYHLDSFLIRHRTYFTSPRDDRQLHY